MTVFKAILTGEGSLYGNLMQDNFHKTAVPKKKKGIVNLSLTAKDCTKN